MLGRAARRKAQLNALVQSRCSLESIQLPWLYPISLRCDLQHRQHATATLRRLNRIRTRRGDDYRSSSAAGERRLATATSPPNILFDEYIPFEGAESQPNPYSSQPLPNDPRSNGLSRALDRDSLLVLPMELPSADLRHWKTKQGMRGELSDVQVAFDASLRSGRFERAEEILRTLNECCLPTSNTLRDCCNTYVQTVLDHTIRTRNIHTFQSLQKTFELSMRSIGVKIDALSYALMIKTCLHLLRGPRKERTVRRYMSMAKEEGCDIELLSLDVLSAAELYKVSEICPTEFHRPVEGFDQFLKSIEEAEVSVSEPLSTEDVRGSDGKYLPEVVPTKQKGAGLASVKQSLSIFSDVTGLEYPQYLQATDEAKDRIFATMRQQRLEDDAINAAMDRWRIEDENMKKMGLALVLENKTVGALMWGWYQELLPIVNAEFKEIDRAEARPEKTQADLERCLYGPSLKELPADKLSAVIVLEFFRTFASQQRTTHRTVASIVRVVGKAVEDEAIARHMRKQRAFGYRNLKNLSNSQRSMALRRFLKKDISKEMNVPETANTATESIAPHTEPPMKEWTRTLRLKVGALAISWMLKVAKLTVKRQNPKTGEMVSVSQPAFQQSYLHEGGRRVGVIQMNTDLQAKLGSEPVSSVIAKHLPMVVEPQKWTGLKTGGYLTGGISSVRIVSGSTDQTEYVRAASRRGDMDMVYKGLDVLGQTAWRINNSVLKVMLDVWNSGVALAKIPPADPQLEMPQEPPQDAGHLERKTWANAMVAVHNKLQSLHSQRCFQNFQLEIARAFAKEERIFFPHNLDFRGRAYPIPPYFNHMSADNCRGLLEFSEGKALGSAGLAWLKVHLANVYGYDKASFQERQEFVMEHLPDVYDSALNPLDGKRWWLNAEDPWQCLAACMELRAALDSPDPTRFVSHLPVHQDGTCNGLQHYAALGGDAWGAAQVNLEPSDRPADIYSGVADLVREAVAKDAKDGIEVAKILEHKITRKVVKQTVMTNVYGVTYMGAKEQVARQLRDSMPDFKHPTENIGSMSRYIAKQIFGALSTMFQGAHNIQFWLGECAARISMSMSPEQIDRLEAQHAAGKSGSGRKLKTPKKATQKSKDRNNDDQCKQAVIWTTPLKMPVVQPYRKTGSKTVQTCLQNIRLTESNRFDAVNKREQLQGFPPNFIHSLDATHMLLSALKCNEMGLTFAAVHDSFWTHAASVGEMSGILRDEFIRLHSENIIDRLAEEFSARYKDSLFSGTVPMGSVVGNKIVEWRETSRLSETQELFLERKRQVLLASLDSMEREQGLAMVTPASIFESSAGPEDLMTPQELKAQLLGEMPETGTKSSGMKKESSETVGLGTLAPVFSEAPSETVDADLGLEAEGLEVPKIQGKKSSKNAIPKVQFWLPFDVPPIPQKSEWDITKVRESTYFFN